jgi:hypothetical protein
VSAPGSTRASGILAAASVALAIALRGTAFHIVPRSGGAFRGISDPPHFGHIAAALLVGSLVAAFFARRGRAVTPLLALGVAALPFIPVGLGFGEAFLAFQGPVLPLLAASALGAALVLALDPATGAGPRPAFSRFLRLGEPALVALAFGFYLLLGTRLPGPAGPQGDEPHYLLMAESLLHDHTLDLTKAYRRRAYTDFYAGTLEAHTSPSSPPGHIYSVHTPGLSLLLLPAYALLGYPGARLVMSAVAALTGGLVYRLVLEVTERRFVATAVWAVVTFLPPLPFYAVALYPEVPAGFATALFLLTSRARRPATMVLLAAAAAAALPWLHPKFLPLALLGMTLTLLRPLRPAVRWAGIALPLLSIGALLFFFERVYGQASFSAAYGSGFAKDVSLMRVPWGLSGLFLDRQFGLLWMAPLFVLAVPGALALWSRRPGDALRALLLGGASLGMGAAFSMWWGGACPPGRFLIPALPALALALALALPGRRVLAGALAGLGAAVTVLAAEAPRAIHNRADGESGLLTTLAPALNLSARLPSFVGHDPTAALLGTTLVAALALAWSRGRRGFLLGALAYLLLGSALAEVPLVSERGATLAILEAWDKDNIVGFFEDLDLPRLELPLDLPGAPWTVDPSSSRTSRRIDLPPGLYDVRVRGQAKDAAAHAHATRVTLAADDLELLRVYLDQGSLLAEAPLLLPAGVRRLVAEARGAEGIGLVEGVGLVPEALVPRSRRADVHWPRLPTDDRYRVGSGDVRITALDRSAPTGEGFRVVGEEGLFLLEAPQGAEVELRVSRGDVRPQDALVWGGRPIPLSGSPALVSLTLKTDGGTLLGGTVVLPFRLRAYGASIGWSGSARVTSATRSRDASPPPLPTVTTMSPPPDSGKK